MKLRRLPDNEYDRVTALYKHYSATLPDPNVVGIFVMENEDNEIISMVSFELVQHLGPIWTDPDYQKIGCATELIEFVTSTLRHPSYYMFPSTPASKRVAEKCGLIKTDWEVWKKEP